jgi:protein TonB
MFEDSLFESGHAVTTSRGATTAVSAAFQSVLLGIAVLVPMLYTEALPHTQTLALTLPSPPRGAPPVDRAPETHQQDPVQTEVVGHSIIVPIQIPDQIPDIHDEAMPPAGPPGPSGPWVPGGTGEGPSGIPAAILQAAIPVRPHFEPPSRVAMGGDVTLGHLVRRVEPIYPELAIRARIQGDVLLRAVISRDGNVQNMSVVGGHPMLAQAALVAVRLWRYQPFLLNGQPIEVDTEITVRFRLER